MRTYLSQCLTIVFLFSLLNVSANSNLGIANTDENLSKTFTEEASYSINECGEAILNLCSFTDNYITSFYDPTNTSIADVEIYTTANGYEMEFLYQRTGTFYSQRLLLNDEGMVTSEAAVKTHGTNRNAISKFYNYHYTASSVDNDITVTRFFSSDGTVNWTRNYTLFEGIGVSRLSVYEAGDRVIIKGRTGQGDNITGGTMFLIITDLSGNEIGQAIHPPDGSNVAPFILSATQTTDGGFLLEAQYLNRTANMIRTAFDGSFIYEDIGEGDLVTAKYYWVDLADPFSSYYTAAEGGSNNFAYVRKSNLSNGSIIWQRNLKDAVLPGNDNVSFQWLNGVVKTDDGGVIAGYSARIQFPFDVKNWAVKYDGNGNVVWTRLLGENEAEGFENNTVNNAVSDNGFFVRFDSGLADGSIEFTKFNADGLQLPECGGGGGACSVAVTSSNGGVNITGLTSDANVKLFDGNILSVWECNPWQGNPCSGNETIPGLINNATYFLSVQSPSCDEWIPIVIQGGGNTATCFDGIQNQGETGIDCGGPCTPCNNSCNIVILSANGTISVGGLTSDANAKLFDPSITEVWSCNPWQGGVCTAESQIFDLTVGATYFLSVESAICSEWIPILVLGEVDCNCPAVYDPVCADGITFPNACEAFCAGYNEVINGECDSGCPDSDGDGVCNILDCQPNDPNLPTTPGSSCNDFNSNTINDVIQSDGCTCQGTSISGCNVSMTSQNGAITITGLTSDANVKLFTTDIVAVWGCNPWQGQPCTNNENVNSNITANILVTGDTYFLSVESSQCSEWIPIVIEGIPDCFCPDFYDPVCGNGITFANACEAECAGVTNYTQGECGCICPDVFDPVCANGIVYSNACEAECVGVFNYFPGICFGSNGADLLANGLTIGPGVPGTIQGFSFNLLNQGIETAVGDYTIKTYISTDAVLSSDDIQEGTIITGNTPIGSIPVSGAILVPNLPSGTYTFFLVVDDDNVIPELNEFNNSTQTSFFIANSLDSPTARSTGNDQESNAQNEVMTPSILVGEIFPNPTSGEVFSKIESTFDGEISIQVVNILGQVNLERKMQVAIGTNNLQLQLNELENGIYHVIIHDGINLTTKQFVVSK